ncbi:response regulator, partial [Oxalobacteraceae bacterium OM1]
MLIPKVLVVNDDPATLVALESLLTGRGWAQICTVVTAQSGEQALRHVLTDDFAVILLDVHMPRMDGFETAEAIHSHPRSAGTPIIFTTAYFNDDVNRLKGYQKGAVDYLITPVIPQILQTKIVVFVELAKRNIALQGRNERLETLNGDFARRHTEDQRRLDSILDGRRRTERRRAPVRT